MADPDGDGDVTTSMTTSTNDGGTDGGGGRDVHFLRNKKHGGAHHLGSGGSGGGSWQGQLKVVPIAEDEENCGSVAVEDEARVDEARVDEVRVDDTAKADVESDKSYGASANSANYAAKVCNSVDKFESSTKIVACTDTNESSCYSSEEAITTKV